MIFRYAPAILSRFPNLCTLTLVSTGIASQSASEMARHRLLERARSRLALCNEGGMPEIQAWRRAFSEMGLKPTQYRCAAEALLRRLRTEADLPRVHPLIDVCNAASAAYAIPIAVFDTARMASLEVRPAAGTEVFETFSGDIEHPEPGEIVFVDEEGRAHARRWTHRQSRHSAVGADTQSVLIVAEALHPDAASDFEALGQSLRDAITEGWPHAQIVEESRC